MHAILSYVGRSLARFVACPLSLLSLSLAGILFLRQWFPFCAIRLVGWFGRAFGPGGKRGRLCLLAWVVRRITESLGYPIHV